MEPRFCSISGLGHFQFNILHETTLCPPCHIPLVPHYCVRFDADSSEDISNILLLGKVGGGCGLVEVSPSFNESARPAFNTKGEGASRWRPK